MVVCNCRVHTSALLVIFFLYRIIWSSFFKPSPSRSVIQAIFKHWTPRSDTRCQRSEYLLKKSQVFLQDLLIYTNRRFWNSGGRKGETPLRTHALDKRRESQSPRQQIWGWCEKEGKRNIFSPMEYLYIRKKLQAGFKTRKIGNPTVSGNTLRQLVFKDAFCFQMKLCLIL